MVPPTRVLVAGGTGTIGRATVRALRQRGDDVVCLGRASAASADVRGVDLQSAESIVRDGIRGERFDAIISCLASRTGAPDEAWAIDHRAHLALLEAAQRAGIAHFVLLSAICVQKPRLQFQFAKLAFEDALQRSGLRYSIVRPTAYFKSLSGQVERVRRGKSFVVFGDGTLTACRPISDDDLAAYLIGCLADPRRWDRVLPIGGPGPALTPRAQGELLFAAAGRAPRFSSVPLGVMNAIVRILGGLARVIPALRAKAEFARIGQYYATESMLVWDAARSRYDANATPSFGTETLADHYARLLRGDATDDRGAHAVF